MLNEALYERYLARLVAGDRRACQEMVMELQAAGMGVEAIYTQLFHPSLYRVGELWEQGKISVAVEHLATAITERLMALVYPAILQRPGVGKAAIVSCAANEFHQIGGRMVADAFEMAGWDSHFLGANTPPDDLLRLVEAKRPSLVALSLSVYFNLDGLLASVRGLRAAHPDTPILVGGQAFRWGGPECLEGIPGVRHVASLPELRGILAEERGDAADRM